MKSEEMIRQANFFFEKKITIHIDCHNGKFYNGLIIEVIGEDCLIVNDRILGEIPVYFIEISNIEAFRGVGA